MKLVPFTDRTDALIFHCVLSNLRVCYNIFVVSNVNKLFVSGQAGFVYRLIIIYISETKITMSFARGVFTCTY